MPGPVFANVLLADEINRTPPKTQAALLEAMQERRVTVQGRTYDLEPPFFVFATQNPIELEGTYPLPEAQLDRFMFEIVLDYLPEEEEVAVVRATTTMPPDAVKAVVIARGDPRLPARRAPRAGGRRGDALRRAARAAHAARRDGAPDFIKQWVSYGASVRAAQALILGAKARALLQGRTHVTFDDMRALALPVLRHRILLNFQAQSEKVRRISCIDEAARRRRPRRARRSDRARPPPPPSSIPRCWRGSPISRCWRGRWWTASCTASIARCGSGSSIDFAQHRAYQPGDDLRRIDWRRATAAPIAST